MTPLPEDSPQLRLRTARNICANGVEVERPENGQVDQQKRRRPPKADAFLRPTNGYLFPSHTRKKGSRWSPSSATPNSDHINGSDNGPFNSPWNSTTALATAREGKHALTAWELPDLIRPLPVRQRPAMKRPRLLPHYPAVIEFVYASRFATGSQIQRRFPQYLTTQRTTQYQLAALVQLGYLQTAPVRSTSPNFPFVYATTKRGMRLVAETYARLGIISQDRLPETTKSTGIALSSILHELLTTEFDLAVWKTVNSRGDLDRLFCERRYFQRDKQLRFQQNGRTHCVVPDSGFLLRVGNQASKRPDASLLLHFVELDNGTMPLPRILAKFQMYDRWTRSDEGQNYLQMLYAQYGDPRPQPSFRLLVIAHAGSANGSDFHRMTDLLMQTSSLPSAMRDRIWFTTAEQLRREQNTASPLSIPLWLRARDIKSWISEYRHHTATLSSEQMPVNSRQSRAFIAKQAQKMPLHTIFPAV